jgi:uncharacterized protein
MGHEVADSSNGLVGADDHADLRARACAVQHGHGRPPQRPDGERLLRAEATQAVDRRTAAALDAARNAGVADRDIRALAITVQPVWDWHEGQRRFRGHEATRVIELTVRDIDLWPDLLAGLIRSRVDRIDSVEADHSERDALTRQALQAAVHDARSRADLLADAAGTRVSNVFSVRESSRGWTEPMRPEVGRAMMARDAAPVPEAYEPGVIVISSEVQATFELRGARRTR